MVCVGGSKGRGAAPQASRQIDSRYVAGGGTVVVVVVEVVVAEVVVEIVVAEVVVVVEAGAEVVLVVAGEVVLVAAVLSPSDRENRCIVPAAPAPRPKAATRPARKFLLDICI